MAHTGRYFIPILAQGRDTIAAAGRYVPRRLEKKGNSDGEGPDVMNHRSFGSDGPQGPINECIRCGTCCRKGGPSLHREDRALLEQGHIRLDELYTIRAGEPAHDNVRGGLVPAPSDIIKIRGRKGSWMCLFLEEADNRCRIYAHRPIECRRLKCWDTRDLEKMYAQDRLTRRDLVGSVEGLNDLIETHHRRCSYAKIREYAEAMRKGRRNSAEEELMEMIRYDLHLRRIVPAKAQVDPQMLAFFFGRPLVETIEGCGVRVRRTKGGMRLEVCR